MLTLKTNQSNARDARLLSKGMKIAISAYSAMIASVDTVKGMQNISI
jgi:hypothetical protein